MAENKYQRIVVDLDGNKTKIDVYTVLEAFAVFCPARQHAIKKLLCSGLRGKGDVIQDLTEAAESVARAIGLQAGRAILNGPTLTVTVNGVVQKPCAVQTQPG